MWNVRRKKGAGCRALEVGLQAADGRRAGVMSRSDYSAAI
jgi:hypothetical protein